MYKNIHKYLRIPIPARYKPAILVQVMAALLMGSTGHAQQGSSGNTTIFGGVQMTFFGNHNFVLGGSGVQPGIVNTVRSSASGPGVLNYTSGTITVTGANEANHVDGYVRKFGTAPFIFPVGDNSHYGPFAAQGDGTVGAYYFVNPTIAVTSMLPAGNYPVLPAGGPFASSAFDNVLARVSTIEYWDIDGTNPTPLTLTWNAASDISGLTAADLGKLTIAGWDGTKWVAIASAVNTTSVLGGASSLSAGSITTSAPLAPDTYTVYTLAARNTPLPVTLMAFTVRPEGGTARLTWSTTAETNSDRFEIQRSSDSRNWTKIGEVASHRESAVLQNYAYTDLSPMKGENLYRLKMIDLDGSLAYSRIRNVSFGDSRTAISVYPNPSADRVYISDYTQVKSLKVSDLNGRLVYSSESFAAGNGSIDVKGFSQGEYIVQVVRTDGTVYAQKVLVHK